MHKKPTEFSEAFCGSSLLKVKAFRCAAPNKNRILDFAALNQQRQKLNGARKVSIFVSETSSGYEKLKRQSLVEIKRRKTSIRI